MYTLPVLLSTAPSMFSAHNKYQTHNLCTVATLLTPTTQLYICRTSSLFNSNVHFTVSIVNCTFNIYKVDVHVYFNSYTVNCTFNVCTVDVHVHFTSSTPNCPFSVLITLQISKYKHRNQNSAFKLLNEFLSFSAALHDVTTIM